MMLTEPPASGRRDLSHPFPWSRMMKLRALVLPCLLSAGLLVPAAHAQRQGTFEFGLFARKNWFGESYALENRAGGGSTFCFSLPIERN